jgi:hypothetical protein
MSTIVNETGYILFFRQTKDWDKGLSAEEKQRALDQLMTWMEGLSQRGIVKGGQPLENVGRIVSGKKGGNVADGPFAESKEAVGGFLWLQVGHLDEAVEEAQMFPLLEFGALVEVRPVAAVCPTIRRINTEMATAAA